MKTLAIIILALMTSLLAWKITQHYHLSKDTWTCTESRVLYEIDAEGGSKQIVTCLEYKRILAR